MTSVPYAHLLRNLSAQDRMRALSSRSLTKLLFCARSNETTRRRLEAMGISVSSIRAELHKREHDGSLADDGMRRLIDQRHTRARLPEARSGATTTEGSGAA